MPNQLLRQTTHLAETFLESLPTRPVDPQPDLAALRESLGGPLPTKGQDPTQVIEDLAKNADPGLIATAGPRYFGFVIGAALPVALAADWLTSTWDQNNGLYISAPAATVIEEITAKWLLELFGLPAESGVGFVTGCQMANCTALAAARHAVLARVGWDVARDGLTGAPRIHLVANEESHVTIDRALRLLGLGDGHIKRVPSDNQGRMNPDALPDILATCDGPTIVCAQAGNVNTGSFDPIDHIVQHTSKHSAWLHVDGAFGLWAKADPTRARMLTGIERADSWATDAHKWLNVPYDCGIVMVRDAVAHRAAMTAQAAYLVRSQDGQREPHEYGPEASRRARCTPVYAAIQNLGQDGIRDLVQRCCSHAQHMAELLSAANESELLTDVVLNQVLIRFKPTNGSDPDAFTRAIIKRVQEDGTCWLGGTVWKKTAAMRISISGWSTTTQDIERSAQAILDAVQNETAQSAP